MYLRMRGGAIMYFILRGISNTRQRPGMPIALSAGDTARHMVLSERSGSATTRRVVIGSRPRSTHSTDA